MTAETGTHSVVIDATVALRPVLPGPHQAEARYLWQRWIRDDVARLCPDLFASEIPSSLLRQVRFAAMPLATAQAMLVATIGSVHIIAADVELCARALAIAHSVGASKAYDSMYAALAEREGCELWTGDERYWNAAHGQYPWIRWVGEIQL